MLSHDALREWLGRPVLPGDCRAPLRPLGVLADLRSLWPIRLVWITLWHCPACDRVIEHIGPVPHGPEYPYSTAARPGRGRKSWES